QREEAARITQQSIGLALIIGTLALIVSFATAPMIVRLLNLTGTTAESAALFLRIVLAITPLLACETVGVACLRGAGDTRTGMWVMILVNAINMAMSWTLMRGWGPLPALGFPGIAIGTACGEGIGGLIILIVLARGRSGLYLRAAHLCPV